MSLTRSGVGGTVAERVAMEPAMPAVSVEAGERTVFERRAAAVAPLFTYLREHGINRAWVGRQVGRRAGVEFNPARLETLKRGRGVVPPWFVALACEIIGRNVEEVMGAAWIAEFGGEFGMPWREALATPEQAS